MNKSDLAAQVQQDVDGLTKAQAQNVINSIFHPENGAIAKALKNGESVSIPGFGTFKVRARAARTGRNPRTGKEVTIPASTGAGFTAGKTLKEALKAGTKKKK